jgi:RND superfamily putative drug exporter
MANLLYKLGLFSARRAWVVITTWVLILAAAITVFVNFGGTLSTSMSLPGTPSQVVIDDLKSSFPAASRGTGQVVFHKTDGKAFTDTEQQQIDSALNGLKSLAWVSEVQNPFKTQASLDENRQKVTDGQAKLAAAPAELAAAQKKLTLGKKQLAAAKKDLDAKAAALETQAKQLEDAIAQMQANNAPQDQISSMMANQSQLLAGQAQIAAGQTEIAKQAAALEAGQEKVTAGLAAIGANSAKLDTAGRIMAAMKNFRTLSTDNQTASAIVMFKKPLGDIEESQKAAIVSQLSDVKIANVQVEFSQELTKSMPKIGGPAEIIGLVIAAIVLFIMLGTLLAAGLPVFSALIGVGISAMGTLALSSVLDMTATTPMLGVMLGLAVGIDYSLFILNRHRRQLKTGAAVRESIALANGTSGNAVVFAGLTVVIALIALNLTGVGFLGLMGSVGAVAIAVAVLIAITFTPAIISLMGMRVLNKRERAKIGDVEAEHEAETPKNATRPVWATKRPWIAILISVAVLVIAAQPISSMRLGLPDGSSEPVTSTQYKSFTLAAKAFGAGVNGPLVTVATMDKALGSQAKLDFEANVAERIMQLESVSSVVPAAVSQDGKKFLFEVIPVEGPASASTEKLVFALRDLTGEIESKYGASLGVTGAAAANIDISKKLGDALPLYLGTVLILSLFLLILVFRSILIPIIASAGFLLTVFATLGAATAVFQWGWLGQVFDIHDPGPIMSFVPTIIIGVVFGLAMDYQLFLGSGMREAYVHGKSAKDAVNFGIHLSRPVVIAAAIIMITVFGGFAFSELTTVRPIGFGLAVGVLFDAFLVRLVLIPALMTLLGNAAWWMPKWLDRILPDVDVEGAALERKDLH